MYCKIHSLYPPILYLAFFFESFKILWNAVKLVLKIVVKIPILSFKGIIQTSLLKVSTTLNKKRISLLNLLINCKSGKLKPQIVL